jgi:hypothetical protein
MLTGAWKAATAQVGGDGDISLGCMDSQHGTLTWAGDQRMIVSAQAVWRSARFSDEANLVPMSAGWDMTLKLHWESQDKRWT